MKTKKKEFDEQFQTSMLRSEVFQSERKDNTEQRIATNLVESQIQETGQDTQADPECRNRLVSNLNNVLKDMKKLENKRKNLSMRFDFCLTEIFNQIDVGSTGYVTLNNLNSYSVQSGILMNRGDWAVILDRYD